MKKLIALCLLMLAMPAVRAAEANPSDREQYGLRGPVQVCVEETEQFSVPASSDPRDTDWKSSSQTEWDADGRRLHTLYRNPDGSEWEIRYTYNPAGKLLKTAQTNQGKAGELATYYYDGQGRLTSIVYSDRPENPITFHYDEQGHKTKVQVSRAEDFRNDLATAGSPFAGADMPPNLQGGGTATTSFDEHDRPAEVQVRDAHGQIVSRAVRTYDLQGNVIAEKQILDDPLAIFPADVRAAITQQAAIQGENIREQITNLMGGQDGPSSVARTYDDQGRLKQTIRRAFDEESTTETTYNHHSDPATEVTHGRQLGQEIGRGQALSAGEVHYDYQYDQHSNWTEKITSSCSSPGSSCVVTSKIRRTLTYF